MYLEPDSAVNKVVIFSLNLASLVFKTISLCRLRLKSLRRVRYAGVTVISVDSLSFGGSGKTSLVLDIGHLLERRGETFAFISRGYRSRYEKSGLLVPANCRAADVGDEARLIKSRFLDRDLFIGRNRHHSIRQAVARGNRYVVLDDGFQSTDIFRDIKILLHNPGHPYYYLRNFKWLAREDDLVMVLDADEPAFRGLTQHVYGFELQGFYRADGTPEDMKNRSILGFSALGDNARFRRDLERYDLREFTGFPDHHDYTAEDLAGLEARRKDRGIDYLVCTEKDWVKVGEHAAPDVPLIFTRNRIKWEQTLLDTRLNHAAETNHPASLD